MTKKRDRLLFSTCEVENKDNETIIGQAMKWNTYEITAKGMQLTIVLNGIKTADIQPGQFPEGPISLQFGNRDKEAGGPIKWRIVQIRPL